MHSDPIDILLEQNRWATRRLLAACAALSDEQFQQSFEIGPGSLSATTAHMAGALRAWGDLLAGRERRVRVEQDGVRRNPAELLALHEELAADFAASARAHPVDEVLSGTHGTHAYAFTRGAVITHVMTHAMHHRAQCLNMLRRLGVSPLPPSSVLEWTMLVDSAE